MASHAHIGWLKPTGESLSTKDGRPIQVWELVCDYSDASAWSEWAKHFREHYCLDTQLDLLREGTPFSRAEYLRQMVFPDAATSPGPSIRSGDFSEILIADLIQSHFDCWVPRTRYAQKAIRNESTKGTDIFGLKFFNTDHSWSTEDLLISCESKAQLSEGKSQPKLQAAVNDSKKDLKRLAESLNAAKRRLIDQGFVDEALRVQRFQDPVDRPYRKTFGAAALFTTSAYDAAMIGTTDASVYAEDEGLALLVVRANDFKGIAHMLYERAADEA